MELEQILKSCNLYFYNYKLKGIAVNFYQDQIVTVLFKPSWKIKIHTAALRGILTQVIKP